MSTEEQIVANQQNAQLSTGPKTDEGIAVSKLNALKHGLLSKEVFLEGEDEQGLIELTKRLREELLPATEIEAILVDRIIANTWRLRRVLEVERNTMEWQKFYNEIGFGADYENKELREKQDLRKSSKRMVVNSGIDQILRYETTIERSIYKALHELQRIQAARAGGKPSAPLAIDIDVSSDK